MCVYSMLLFSLPEQHARQIYAGQQEIIISCFKQITFCAELQEIKTSITAQDDDEDSTADCTGAPLFHDGAGNRSISR